MSDTIYNEDGFSLYTKKKYLEAIKKFNSAIEINPNNPLYYRNKGFCYFHLKKYEEAIIEYKNALKINPANSSYINNIGNAFLNLNRYDEAYEAYKKANEIDPEEIIYKNNLIVLHKELIKNNLKLNIMTNNLNYKDENNNTDNGYYEYKKNEIKKIPSGKDSSEEIIKNGNNHNKIRNAFSFNENNSNSIPSNSSYDSNNTILIKFSLK